MTIKFGTDGWRAVISETFTFGNLRLVAQAIADYVRDRITSYNVCYTKLLRKFDGHCVSSR